MGKEISLIEINSGDYKIQLTNKNVKIMYGLFLNPFILKYKMRWLYKTKYGRMPVTMQVIPLKNIKSIQYENGKLKIIYITAKREYGKTKIFEIRVKKHKGEVFKQAFQRLLKGEDPMKICKDYSPIFMEYRENIEETGEIISITEDEIEIKNAEIQKITGKILPIPIYNPMLTRTLELFKERIRIDQIIRAEIEEQETRGETKYQVKLKLINGKMKIIKFGGEKEKARKFLSVLFKMILMKSEEKEKFKFIQSKASTSCTSIPSLFNTSMNLTCSSLNLSGSGTSLKRYSFLFSPLIKHISSPGICIKTSLSLLYSLWAPNSLINIAT